MRGYIAAAAVAVILSVSAWSGAQAGLDQPGDKGELSGAGSVGTLNKTDKFDPRVAPLTGNRAVTGYEPPCNPPGSGKPDGCVDMAAGAADMQAKNRRAQFLIGNIFGSNYSDPPLGIADKKTRFGFKDGAAFDRWYAESKVFAAKRLDLIGTFVGNARYAPKYETFAAYGFRDAAEFQKWWDRVTDSIKHDVANNIWSPY